MRPTWLLPLALLAACSPATSAPQHPGPRAVENKQAPDSTGIVSIETGTFYGECTEYCWTELLMRPSTATLVSSAWKDRPPKVTERRELSSAAWSKLVGAVDKAAFLALPEVIGCPDCTDGGGEWIEIDFGSAKKRVTFQANAAVPALDGLTAELRPVRKELSAAARTHR
jgi:hypothetical protein